MAVSFSVGHSAKIGKGERTVFKNLSTVLSLFHEK
jgi:hypothetical protein